MDPTVKEWMTGDPVSIAPDASALEALERMVERGIRHLPVVDGEHRVVGLLSLDDLRAALPMPVDRRRPLSPSERDAAREWCVGELMTHAPQTIQEDGDLADAAERMAEARLGCLPVVDEQGRLAAVLSETDLLHALATALWSERMRGASRDLPLVDLIESLRRERRRLLDRVASHQASEATLTRTLREEPLDLAERAADVSEIDRLEALDDLARRRVEAIDLALARAAQGRLAVCTRCGGEIALTRLRALPGTELCVACARQHRPGGER